MRQSPAAKSRVTKERRFRAFECICLITHTLSETHYLNIQIGLHDMLRQQIAVNGILGCRMKITFTTFLAYFCINSFNDEGTQSRGGGCHFPVGPGSAVRSQNTESGGGAPLALCEGHLDRRDAGSSGNVGRSRGEGPFRQYHRPVTAGVARRRRHLAAATAR